MSRMILFPSSYFSVQKVDEDLQKEYEAVLETGLFDVVFFGYDKWFQEDKIVLSREIPEPVQAVYRGWMMKPAQYRAFYEALQANNIQLLTTPHQYELFHVFPNVYPLLEADTARMLVYPDGKAIDVREAGGVLGRFMVKDYVKSVKGTEFPRYFEADTTQEEFDHWMEVFYKYRGKLYTGGICLKQYLDLQKYNGHTNEYRVFYIDHEAACVSRNSGQGSSFPEPPRELMLKYAQLPSPFYTIDYAELTDGSWKILEAGDGSVSGLSEGQNYGAFFRTLQACLEA